MKRSEAFKTRFLNADNVNHSIIGTISFVKMETLESRKGEVDKKPVVYFSDLKQNLVLNPTRWDEIVEITGEDADDRWVDSRIEIYRTMTEVGGKPTPCIRCRAPSEMTLKKPAAKSMPRQSPDDLPDEIPD